VLYTGARLPRRTRAYCPGLRLGESSTIEGREACPVVKRYWRYPLVCQAPPGWPAARRAGRPVAACRLPAAHHRAAPRAAARSARQHSPRLTSRALRHRGRQPCTAAARPRLAASAGTWRPLPSGSCSSDQQRSSHRRSQQRSAVRHSVGRCRGRARAAPRPSSRPHQHGLGPLTSTFALRAAEQLRPRSCCRGWPHTGHADGEPTATARGGLGPGIGSSCYATASRPLSVGGLGWPPFPQAP
jgi:hypothetical protein